jgi:hypothetical protein
MINFIGRVLLVAALVFSAYTLYDHSETINKFNSNLPAVLKHCNCVPAEIIKLVT